MQINAGNLRVGLENSYHSLLIMLVGFSFFTSRESLQRHLYTCTIILYLCHHLMVRLLQLFPSPTYHQTTIQFKINKSCHFMMFNFLYLLSQFTLG